MSSTTSGPMKCPRCGSTMNHHADKLIEPRTREEAARMDAAMGGVIEEQHACPACGASASRPGA